MQKSLTVSSLFCLPAHNHNAKVLHYNMLHLVLSYSEGEASKYSGYYTVKTRKIHELEL
uniref:Uncharacterized protein n=1 Tax=Arundo donax TaxID=35708 RepID=A0A0A9HKC1_ARUDO